MAYARRVLSELLKRKDLIGDALERLAAGGSDADFIKPSGLFVNEFTLYMDPGRRFSVRGYFHPPRSRTAIHDHNAWGVSGTPAGALEIVKYRIQHPETKSGERLMETERRLLSPGAIDTTLPLDRGIHTTGTPDEQVNLMISVYGSPVRRLHINVYEPESGRILRRYPRKIALRKLVHQVLASL